MILALILFLLVMLLLMAGYPVAFTLAGASLMVAGIAILTGHFDPAFLTALPNRIYGGVMTNDILVAVPLFVFLGVMLEQTKIASELLTCLGRLLQRLRGGMALAVLLVGVLLAASTGIVGATVVTMGLLALPSMQKQGYDPRLSTGIVCASGTLGQIIPPSIVLVLLGDVLSSAYQQAQVDMGVFSPKTVSVGDLFLGALLPALILVVMYAVYLFFASSGRERPAVIENQASIGVLDVLLTLIAPITLMIVVLGSIMSGIASPTEAAGIGALAATLLALLKKKLSLKVLREVAEKTTRISSMVFLILIGASVFSLVFRGLEGDTLVQSVLTGLPGGAISALFAVMIVMFLLGFVLDFIEITFVIVPIVGPALLAMGIDPVWLGIMIAINLQTSFLTPPFGFALFYLRGVTDQTIATGTIYRGVMPFVIMQLALLIVLALFPQLATWLPNIVYN